MTKNFYKKEIKRAATIDELVWIKTDCSEDCRTLGWDAFSELMKLIETKRANLEAQGQTYRRARKPSWR